MNFKKLILLFSCLLFINNAHALTVESYKEFAKNKDPVTSAMIDMYIAGAVNCIKSLQGIMSTGTIDFPPKCETK